jgi:hypothetical protein
MRACILTIYYSEYSVAAIVHNCNVLLLAISFCYTVSMSGASLLIYLRVRAVFHDNRIVQALFAIPNGIYLGAVMTVPFSIKGIRIGPTQYCINFEVHSLASVTVIVSTVNGTLIIVAISYELVKNNNYVAANWSVNFQNKWPQHEAWALYQGGQIYFLYVIKISVYVHVGRFPQHSQ